MGAQFWWFYDVAAAAVLLVAIFLSARKPISKAVSSLIAFGLGLVVALSASSSIAGSMYKTAMRGSNADKIEKALEEDAVINKTKAYIESLGYNVVVKTENLGEIFAEATTSAVYIDVYEALYEYTNNINGRVVDTEEAFREKMTAGFAEIISDIVGENLSAYAAETAAAAVIDDPDSINEFLVLTQQENMTEAAKYIADNYTAAAYTDVIRLISFIILMFIVVLAVKFFAHALIGKNSEFSQLSIAEHLCGGLLGLFTGAIIVFVAAVAVRTYTVFGSGEMLFFNDDVIDKTLFFKYVYNLAAKL